MSIEPIPRIGPSVPRRYRREIALALAVKAAALIALYLLFFAPAHQLPASGEATASHLLAPAARPEVTR
jgi:hypothetical protein